eukprot:TRINITY_DN20479_c0_g1_i2.p2 TRINITY_DN20479_c0_g1~~TRINITY_DN20479_c0_g1_i2.p2  ORF type:complete len:155 (-),score=33.69 TRINITY_DN20479_c0_g1_i2:611-1075(-)
MLFFFFFFKQKTAYEMLRSLVGSEMCIRDRLHKHQSFRTCQKTFGGMMSKSLRQIPPHTLSSHMQRTAVATAGYGVTFSYRHLLMGKLMYVSFVGKIKLSNPHIRFDPVGFNLSKIASSKIAHHIKSITLADLLKLRKPINIIPVLIPPRQPQR